MANEYKLSYTAEEINNKLGQVDSLAEQIGNLGSSGQAIIDVTELPTEGVSEGAFYRLMSAQFVYNKNIYSDWTCKCVDGLPEIGEPVSTDMVNITSYYNVQDGITYGYADENISAAGGVPVGWYTMDMLAAAFDMSWSGAITHIDNDPCDDSFRILLKYDFYVYKDGWMNVPFGYEASAFDIRWDGDMTDRMVLDMSALGYDNLYYVKVSDKVLTADELRGSTVEYIDYVNNEVQSVVIGKGNEQGLFPFDQILAGAIVVSDFYNSNNFIIVVHDVDALAVSLGIPTGIYTNGVYFYLYANEAHISRLVAPTKVTKIDEKFLPAMDVDVDIWGSLPKPTTADNGKILQVVNGEAAWVGVNIAEEANF